MPQGSGAVRPTNGLYLYLLPLRLSFICTDVTLFTYSTLTRSVLGKWVGAFLRSDYAL